MKTGKKIIVLMVLVFVLMPIFAQAVSWLPLVPCGVSNDNPDTPQDERKLCNQCDLMRLFKNIIDFVLIGLMPPAAAILFVWGGFLILMGGANPGLITQGKSIFWNTAIGIAIISSSWLITNTIVRSLAADNVAPEWWKFECRVTTPAQQPPAPGPGQPPVPQPGPGQPPAPVPQPGSLTITTSSLSDARQDFNYSQTIQATGGEVPYDWSVTGSLPSGIEIDSSTGEISGTPTVSGNYTFTVTVEDSSPAQDLVSKQLSIKVVAPAASIVISNVASSNITANSATITWTTDKPSTSQIAYGTTTAYGPPTTLNSSQVTNHSVTLSGLNGNTTYNYQAISSIAGFTARSSNDDFKTLLSSTQFSILISLLPDAVAGIPYSETIPLDGGLTPYRWSVIGTLPPGLKGNPVTGEISGTPTTPGTSTVTVKVEDSSTPKKTVTKPITIKVITGTATTNCGDPNLVCSNTARSCPALVKDTSSQQSSTKQLSIVVSAQATKGSSPEFPLSASILSVTTSSLPNATQNKIYSQSVSVNGGIPPYTWSVSKGSLPTGLTLNKSNGTISGTPTKSGTFNFTIKVNDSTGSPPQGQSSWAYLIPSAAHSIPGVNTTKFLQAIMSVESNGRINIRSGSTPPSCGIMQMQAGEANKIRTRCGINHPISCEWLEGKELGQGETFETVARASICMASEYSISIKNGSCYGGQVRDLAAGYNGGGGCDAKNNKDNALAKSVSCSQTATAQPKYDLDCSGRATLRYECLWDDLVHTKCNAGFAETRDYAAKFNACYTK